MKNLSECRLSTAEFPRLNNEVQPSNISQSFRTIVRQSQINSVEKARLLLEAGKLYLNLEWLPKAKMPCGEAWNCRETNRGPCHLGCLQRAQSFRCSFIFSQLLQVCARGFLARMTTCINSLRTIWKS